ncbi:MAG: exo-alpha-sialidase, partial [Verrucomicrobiota bacterium]
PLLEDPSATLDREALFFHYPHYYPTTTPVSAIRQGPWKLLHYYEEDLCELYHLENDPSEQSNLALQHPDRVKTMKEKLDRWRSKMGAQMPEKPATTDEPPRLWNESASLPRAADLPTLPGTRFHVIKRHEPDKDGYGFLHGLALAFHKGRLFASFGHNKGLENTGTEQARWCVSEDLGRTWSEPQMIDPGSDDLAVSHGVFHRDGDTLWAFLGAFEGTRKNVRTRAYRFDDDNQQWISEGDVIGDGFWPMEEPRRLSNGNWLMSGLIVGKGNPPGVAITRGDDLTDWIVSKLKPAKPAKVWGESTTWLQDHRLVNVSRFGEQARALVAISEDLGKTWSAPEPSNLPMVTSKPYAGRLRSGHAFLLGTSTADSGHRRSPLTIAISPPGDSTFNRVWTIREAVFPEGPGESHPGAALAYPYAIEHEENLYVAYSNNGGRKGHNLNSAELAVIP